MIRSTVPTKFAGAGVSIGSGVSNGSGVPSAIGASGGIFTEGTTGVTRKLIAIETSDTTTRNRTQSRIRSFTGPMAGLLTTNVPNRGVKAAAVRCLQKTSSPRRQVDGARLAIETCTKQNAP